MVKKLYPAYTMVVGPFTWPRDRPLLRGSSDRGRGLEALVATVVGFVEAPNLGLDLPLDVRGTAFQQRVWQALQERVGQTASYAEVARRIGSPRAVRVAAAACAANNLAVAIPCHRVVRNDGSLCGYAWGVERKRVLLDREAACARRFIRALPASPTTGTAVWASTSATRPNTPPSSSNATIKAKRA